MSVRVARLERWWTPAPKFGQVVSAVVVILRRRLLLFSLLATMMTGSYFSRYYMSWKSDEVWMKNLSVVSGGKYLLVLWMGKTSGWRTRSCWMDATMMGDSTVRCFSCMKSRWPCHSIVANSIHKHLMMRPAKNTVGSMVLVCPVSLTSEEGRAQSTDSSGSVIMTTIAAVMMEELLDPVCSDASYGGKCMGIVVFHLYGSHISSNSIMLLLVMVFCAPFIIVQGLVQQECRPVQR
jgi:hypothetical protein